MHRGFDYASLHNVALTSGLLPTTGPLFTRFGTTNFEYVLLACWRAELVNAALATSSDHITAAYHEVRAALIQAVHGVHPDYTTILPLLERVGRFASSFGTVVTLNYDLTFYWAMMLINSRVGQWFKDAFIESEFEPHWHFLRRPRPPARGATMVFYAHGSLVLVRDSAGRESKIALGPAGPARLLDTITTSWAAGAHAPILVSEGGTSSKATAIRRSPYLSTVYDHVLQELGDCIVIYGFGFSDNDQHILDALMKRPPADIAISVNTAQVVANQQAYCHRVMGKIAGYGVASRVWFFDAQSAGCWSNT